MDGYYYLINERLYCTENTFVQVYAQCGRTVTFGKKSVSINYSYGDLRASLELHTIIIFDNNKSSRVYRLSLGMDENMVRTNFFNKQFQYSTLVNLRPIRSEQQHRVEERSYACEKWDRVDLFRHDIKETARAMRLRSKNRQRFESSFDFNQLKLETEDIKLENERLKLNLQAMEKALGIVSYDYATLSEKIKPFKDEMKIAQRTMVRIIRAHFDV